MIKHTPIALTIVLLTSCEFVNKVSKVHEELTTRKLGTETMSPRNEYNKIYEIDYDNKQPKRFDIIEFQFDDEYVDRDDFYSSNQRVSRVIGMPNETIELKNGLVYINDTLLNQPFLIDSCLSKDNYSRREIGEDFYFVMVDHRKMIQIDSTTGAIFKPYDSRKIGLIHISKIVGVTNLK